MITDEMKADGQGPVEISRLHERLNYDPATGAFVWKRSASMPVWWNNRYGGVPTFICRSLGGYNYSSIDGFSVIGHRVAWAMHYGYWPDGEIDHIDHNKSNNAIANLRVVNRSANNQNQPMRRDNTSGTTGVVLTKNGKWQAQIGYRGKVRNLGKFQNIEDAIGARQRAEMALGFHKNHGQTPKPEQDHANG